MFRATSLDDAAAATLKASPSWSLVGRFERALIISCEPDETMVSLVRNDLPNGPYTVRLDRSAPRDLRSVDASPALDLTSATHWSVLLVKPSETVDGPELVRRLGLFELLGERASEPRRGWSDVIDTQDLQRLEDALMVRDSSEAAAIASRIAGLGPGLTPSGDDLLAGMLAFDAWAETAGHGATGGRGEATATARRGAAAIASTGTPDSTAASDPAGSAFRIAISETVQPRTTRFAGQLVSAAVRGHVAAPVAALLTSIFRRGGTFPPDLAPVLAIGETSGGDTLAGIRLAGRAHCRSYRSTAAAEGAQ